jgi:hypothetical protein
MDDHRRMTRMLAALVGSMTAGALCLDLMQPSGVSPSTAPGIELMALGPASRVWVGIRVEARPQDKTFRPEDSHFVVYRNGSPARTTSWESQRVLGPSPMVRVTLLGAADGRTLTPAQRSTARTLVLRLQKLCGIPAHRVLGAETLAQGTQPRSLADPAQSYAVANAE